MCASSRRLQKELTTIQSSDIGKWFKIMELDESNFSKWDGLILPEFVPYNKGAFRICIEFPVEYPFKPPKIYFKTPIYHPNIDDKGHFCLPIINTDNWKPATKTDQILQSLLALLNDPELEHPLNTRIAEEYAKDKKKFIKSAEEHTKKYGEKRPE